MKRKSSIGWALALMGVFAVTRWPGLLPENFSAAYSLTFCAGVYFAGGMAWWLPLSALLLTNCALNLFYYDGFALLDPYSLAAYSGFACLIWLGRRFRPSSGIGTLMGGSVLGAVMFYILTNTFSWMYDPTYPKNLAGWVQALTRGTAGWPETWTFFRNTILSSGLFTGLFVAAMKWNERWGAEEREQGQEELEPAVEEDAAKEPQAQES